MSDENIIIVDDSYINRKRLSIMLKRAGLTVKEFKNGKEAFAYLITIKKNLPLVIITDMNMPVMDGFEFIENIKYAFDDAIALIALTAFTDKYPINEVFARGITDYIEKPGTKLEIVTRVRQAIKIIKNKRKHIEIEKQLTDILESIHAGIVIIDAESHNIVNVNPMAEKMIGFSKNEIIGNVCHNFICPAEKGKCPITDLNQKVDNSEKILISKEGKEVPILKTVAITSINKRKHLVESFLDISKIKKIQEELKLQAITDPLTGLYNRRHFLDLFQKEFDRSFRKENTLSLIMIELDIFNIIYDKHGHQAGDKAITSFANIVKSMLRNYDIICRYGGEEFAILCPQTNIEYTYQIAKRIMEQSEKDPILFYGMNITITASIGVTTLLNDDKNTNNIIKRAISALYEAKSSDNIEVIKYPVSNE